MPKAMPAWLAVLFAALLAVGTDEFVIAGVLPELAADLNVSVSAAGQLVTVFAVVYAIGAPTLALVTSRLGRRSLIAASLLVFAAANAGARLLAADGGADHRRAGRRDGGRGIVRHRGGRRP